MITEIDVKDMVYRFLTTAGIGSAISGQIYKDKRPANSTLEDVEISVLASSVDQIQQFIVNVNVFVRDLKRENEMVEDTKRIRTLSTTFMSALEYSVFDGYILALDSQHVEKIVDTDIHAINNRLNIKYNSEN